MWMGAVQADFDKSDPAADTGRKSAIVNDEKNF